MFTDCNAPDANGEIDGATTYSGGSVTLTCNAGYEGGGSITCGTDGTWDMSSGSACSAKGKSIQFISINRH